MQIDALTRQWSRTGTWVPVALLMCGLFLVSWEITYLWFYSHSAHGDTVLYQTIGQGVRNGTIPYRDFSFEYPPGAIAALVVPTFAGSSYESYEYAFSALMAVCGLGCVIAAVLAGASRVGVLFVAVSPLLLGNLARNHFDFWPAMLVAVSLAALVNDRHRIGWATLATAVAVKIFAVVLVPLALVWTLHRRGRTELLRSLGVAACVLILIVAPFAVIAPHGLWDSVAGQLSRPLQIETLAASYLMTFAQPTIMGSHGSKNLPNHDGLAAATSVVSILVIVEVYIAFARGRIDDAGLLRWAAACVVAFVAFGKVLSPQYEVWLVAVVPLVRGRRGLVAMGLLAIAFVNTPVWTGDRYFTDYVYVPNLAWLVFARNLLFVGVLIALLAPERLFGARSARDPDEAELVATG